MGGKKTGERPMTTGERSIWDTKASKHGTRHDEGSPGGRKHDSTDASFKINRGKSNTSKAS